MFLVFLLFSILFCVANNYVFSVAVTSSPGLTQPDENNTCYRYEVQGPLSVSSPVKVSFPCKKINNNVNLPSAPNLKISTSAINTPTSTDNALFNVNSKIPAAETSIPFNVALSCTLNSTICDKVKVGIMNAAQRIAAALSITSTININSSFFSFCDGKPPSECNLSGKLGFGYSIAHFPGKPDGASSNYLIPQALMKQLKSDHRLVLSEFDIGAMFNADYDFWFQVCQI